MNLSDEEIRQIASLILSESNHLFPSSYPDIPLNTSMLMSALSKTGFTVDEQHINDLMTATELKLAAIAPLNWNNYGTLAILLNQAYPDEDMIAISENRILDLVKNLPNFTDQSEPDEGVIDSIIYTWISLNDDEPYFEEDEAWD